MLELHLFPMGFDLLIFEGGFRLFFIETAEDLAEVVLGSDDVAKGTEEEHGS